MNESKLTVIIPTYNEEYGIKNTLDSLLPFVEKNMWKVIIVNDGSTDNTKAELQSLENIKVINHPYNKGYGAAIKSGIKSTLTEYVAFSQWKVCCFPAFYSHQQIH